MTEGFARVLSVQSHVVHGYVGNKCATFPMQVLGIEVDAINSVQFSNHTKYKHVKGQVLTDKELEELSDALVQNGVNEYTHLLTGYVGNANFLKRIAQLVKDLRTVNPQLTYVCDPVMGDNGELYVPEALLPIYRDKIIPLADIVTPNQFEVELLTGSPITNIEEAWVALQWFHDQGVRTVVLSSSDLGDKDYLIAMASNMQGGKRSKVLQRIPKQEGSFTGTGDLFAALFLAHSYRTSNFVTALENTTATLQAVIRKTIESAVGKDKNHMKNLELKIIQCKKYIENPECIIRAEQA